jgi:hypothetical protein
MPPDEDLYAEGVHDVKTAQRFLGLSRASLYTLMGNGRLPYSLVGGKRLLPVRGLKRFLAAHAVVVAPRIPDTEG